MTSGGYHFTLFSWGSTDQILCILTSTVCFKWAYFGNGPDAAASIVTIAPTLIRHWHWSYTTCSQRRHSLLTRVDKVQWPPRSKGPPSATCKNLCHKIITDTLLTSDTLTAMTIHDGLCLQFIFSKNLNALNW